MARAAPASPEAAARIPAAPPTPEAARRRLSAAATALAIVIGLGGLVLGVPRVLDGAARPRLQTADAASTTTTRIPDPVDPARDELTFGPEPGGVITFNGQRLALGSVGDVILGGRWGCAPQPTLILVRPATGAVYSFDGSPSAGHDLTGRLVARIAVPTVTRLGHDQRGCLALTETPDDGVTRTVTFQEPR